MSHNWSFDSKTAHSENVFVIICSLFTTKVAPRTRRSKASLVNSVTDPEKIGHGRVAGPISTKTRAAVNNIPPSGRDELTRLLAGYIPVLMESPEQSMIVFSRVHACKGIQGLKIVP